MKNEVYCIYVTMYTLANHVVIHGYYTDDFMTDTCKNILLSPDPLNAKIYDSGGECRLALNRIMKLPNVIHASIRKNWVTKNRT